MAWSKDNGSQSAVNAAQYVDGKKPLIEQAIVDATEAKPLATSAKAESTKALTTATQADGKATDALAIATSAKTTAETVKGEFDLVVAEAGSSNPEVVQARGGEVNLNARLTKVSAQLAEKATYVNSVAAMKSMNRFNDGDIVTTLGYYSPNDNGGATYIVKSATEIDDGGSVITLSNGKQAHLLTGSSINYNQFGAKLDGDVLRVGQETTAIKNAHAYANINNLPVKQNEGIITLNATVTVQTSTDLSGCKILLKSYAKGKQLYHVTSKKIPIAVTGFNQSELTKNALIIPSLKQYKHHMITIDSNEKLATRQDGAPYPVLKSDSFFLTRDGGLVGGKLIQNFTAGTLTVTARPYEEIELIFSGPKIVWDFQDYTSNCNVILLERSNSTLRNVFLDIPNAVDYDDTANGPFKWEAITIKNCYKVHLENVLGENITEGLNVSGYIIGMTSVVDVTFRNVTLLNGWGATGTVAVKDWKIYDSQINRIDAHTGTGDIYCNNVEFIGGWGVYVGWGDGEIILDNCTSNFVKIDGRELDTVVYLGITYGLVYEGTIKINNHTIKSVSPRYKTLVKCVFEGTGLDYTIAYDIKMPNLLVDGIHFEGTGVEPLYGYYMANLSKLTTTLFNGGKRLQIPEIINIENIMLNTPNDNTYFTAVECYDSGDNAYLKPINTKITLRNIRQKLHSGWTNGFSSALLTNPEDANKQKYFMKNNLLALFFPPASSGKVVFDILLDNCVGPIWVEADIGVLRAINSSFSADVESTAAIIPDRFIMINCDYYSVPSGSLANSLVPTSNLEATSNVFYPFILDGVAKAVLPYSIGGVARRLLHNVFSVDSNVTQANIDKFWRFVEPTIYKVPTLTP